ncbi:MAG: ABC transporter permease [Alphaproteobacteria bacterium]|nr:ABC transporter permease [Alphaproteobacteria bacterium]MBL7097744.1 ABC transporter permease [Alphaproteobacteria bacterium]
MLFALAWRNLWRQPRRTLLSLASIVFTGALLVFMLSFQIGVYGQMKESALKLFDGYAQMQVPGYADDPDLRRSLTDPAGLKSAALAIPGVDAAAARVNAFAILSHGERSFGSAIVGVDPTSEPLVSKLAASITTGRYLNAADSDTIVLGQTLARNLKAAVGDKLTLLGSGMDGSVATDVLTVVGIYDSGIPELDRSVAEIPLSRAQETFSIGPRATTVALAGPSLSAFQNAVPALGNVSRVRGLILKEWSDLEPEVRDSITLKYVTSAMLYVTLVVVVTFIILNTLLMSVLERTREFGVLLAIGMRPSVIGQMVWLELVLLASAGAILAILIGGALALYFEGHGIMYGDLGKVTAQYGLPSRLYPEFSALSALIGPGALFVAISLGGIVPYLHVRRLEAASAMRAA